MQGVVGILGSVTFPTFESTVTLSYEQYERFLVDLEKLTHLFHCELVNGRIYMTPPAHAPHGAVQDNLYRPISNFAHDNRLGRVFGSSTGYRLAADIVLEPDVAFVSNVRLAAMPPLGAVKFVEVAPDLAIEILSPSDPKHDLVEKRAIYEKHGVSEYWIADPARKIVRLLTLEGGKYRETLIGIEGVVESKVLPGLRIPTRDIFDGLE